MTIVTLKKIADFVGLLLVSESKLIPVITLWLQSRILAILRFLTFQLQRFIRIFNGDVLKIGTQRLRFELDGDDFSQNFAKSGECQEVGQL